MVFSDSLLREKWKKILQLLLVTGLTLPAVQNHVPGTVPSRLQELHRIVSLLVGLPSLCGALRELLGM